MQITRCNLVTPKSHCQSRIPRNLNHSYSSHGAQIATSITIDRRREWSRGLQTRRRPGCGWRRRCTWCLRPCRRVCRARRAPPRCIPTACSAGAAPWTASACTEIAWPTRTASSLAPLPLRGRPGAGDAGGGGGTAARVRVWRVFLSRRRGGADSMQEEPSTVAEERDGVGLLGIGNWDGVALAGLGWVVPESRRRAGVRVAPRASDK